MLVKRILQQDLDLRAKGETPKSMQLKTGRGQYTKDKEDFEKAQAVGYDKQQMPTFASNPVPAFDEIEW